MINGVCCLFCFVFAQLSLHFLLVSRSSARAMSRLFRRSSQQLSKEDDIRESSIKMSLTQRLGSAVKCLQQQHINTYEPIYSGDNADNVCHFLEALFIHGLKDTFFEKMSAMLTNNPDRSPEPNFWPLLMIFTHKDVISQINNLSQLNTDVGRCRAWIRVALNDGLLDSYIAAMVQDTKTMEYYYKGTAYLRDGEQPDILRKYLEGLSLFQFKLACNSHMLNIWSVTPLMLAGIWSPPMAPEPVVTGIDVALCFDEGGHPLTPERKKNRPRVRQKQKETRSASNPLGIEGTRSTCSGSEASSLASCPDPIPTQQFNDSVSYRSDTASNPDLVKSFDIPSDTDVAAARTKLHDDDYQSSQSSLCELACGIPVGNETLPDPVSLLRDKDGVNINTGEDSGMFLDDTSIDGQDHSLGNNLSVKVGWSSTFNEDILNSNSERNEKTLSSCAKDESFQALLKNYSPIHSSVIRTPDFSESFTSLAIGGRRRKSSAKEQETQTSGSCSSEEREYEILPKSCSITSDNAEPRTRELIALIGKICNEVGLDAQNYKCKACERPIGMIYGKARVCNYDGHSYCYECHENDESVIPARIVHNWDFKKFKVSKHTKNFLQQIEDEPLIDIRHINPQLYSLVEEMNELQLLRTQLGYLRSYLFTCRESVAEELRRKLWPKEYLYEHIHLYSFSDLLNVPSRSLAQLLTKLISKAIRHVQDCRLCSQKGFICEICNDVNVIYPFELVTTYRCDICLAVYHSVCMNSTKPCPKCERRRKRVDNEDDDFAWDPSDEVS